MAIRSCRLMKHQRTSNIQPIQNPPIHFIIMRSSFFASSALLACAPTASAFWNVYLGSFADPYGGGNGDMAQFFTGEPNCDDVNNRPINFASTGNVERDGWHCEGCNAGQATDDLTITRIEVCVGLFISLAPPNRFFQFSATTDDFSAGRRIIDQQVGIVGKLNRPIGQR